MDVCPSYPLPCSEKYLAENEFEMKQFSAKEPPRFGLDWYIGLLCIKEAIRCSILDNFKKATNGTGMKCVSFIKKSSRCVHNMYIVEWSSKTVTLAEP